MFGRFELGRVFLVLVAHLRDIGMAVKRVVIEIHFGVERNHVADASHDQRINFEQTGVEFGECLVQGGD